MQTQIKKSSNVQELRRAGNKVRVIHYRQHLETGNLVLRREFQDSELIAPRGGKTIVQITTPENKELEGEALCSHKDSFNRKLGLKIAVQRALSGLN